MGPKWRGRGGLKAKKRLRIGRERDVRGCAFVYVWMHEKTVVHTVVQACARSGMQSVVCV